MAKTINTIKVQLNHRLDDRFTVTVKMIGFNTKDIHVLAYGLTNSVNTVLQEIGRAIDRKLNDFYLNK